MHILCRSCIFGVQGVCVCVHNKGVGISTNSEAEIAELSSIRLYFRRNFGAEGSFVLGKGKAMTLVPQDLSADRGPITKK